MRYCHIGLRKIMGSHQDKWLIDGHGKYRFLGVLFSYYRVDTYI